MKCVVYTKQLHHEVNTCSSCAATGIQCISCTICPFLVASIHVFKVHSVHLIKAVDAQSTIHLEDTAVCSIVWWAEQQAHCTRIGGTLHAYVNFGTTGTWQHLHIISSAMYPEWYN
jgi:hypothetical protein